jgi:hypothetical protein
LKAIGVLGYFSTASTCIVLLGTIYNIAVVLASLADIFPIWLLLDDEFSRLIISFFLLTLQFPIEGPLA